MMDDDTLHKKELRGRIERLVAIIEIRGEFLECILQELVFDKLKAIEKELDQLEPDRTDKISRKRYLELLVVCGNESAKRELKEMK